MFDNGKEINENINKLHEHTFVLFERDEEPDVSFLFRGAAIFLPLLWVRAWGVSSPTSF